MEALANLLSLIVQPCYDLTGNWWAAIALFTIIIKVVLMPLALWVQKNSIKMVQIMPKLNRLKVKYYGDRETIGELQTKLNKEQGYHPLLSLIPLAIQILILFGLVDVIHRITDHGAPGTEILGMLPATDGGISWVMPVLAGLSAVLLAAAQNRINPLQREQTKAEKNITNGLSIGLSLILGIFVAAGMAFYWIVSNLSAILVQVICNAIIKPGKYIDYADLKKSREELAVLDSLSPKQSFIARMRDPLIKREKADIARFYNILDKHLVFYSEGSGFYKYFQGAIEWLLENSDIPIHYITKDPEDQIFRLAKENLRIIPYYISEQRLITVMMKMDADMVVTTLGDLDEFYIKRSYIRKDIEYVYMFHHMTSTGPTSHKTEYMNYDTLLCVSPEQVAEQKRFEEVYAAEGVRRKNLVPVGYDLIDREIADYERKRASRTRTDAEPTEERPIILIGPSWQVDNICDSCIDELLESLLGHGWKIVVRPHPEYTKRYPARWKAILERWAHMPEEELYFERDFTSNSTITDSSIVITDWSTVAYEFSYSTKKPSVFINTTPKILNPNYEEFSTDPSDIRYRDELGKSFELSDVSKIPEAVEDMLAESEKWREKISRLVEESVFNLGHGGQAAGEYILGSLLEKQAERQRKDAERQSQAEQQGSEAQNGHQQHSHGEQEAA